MDSGLRREGRGVQEDKPMTNFAARWKALAKLQRSQLIAGREKLKHCAAIRYHAHNWVEDHDKWCNGCHDCSLMFALKIALEEAGDVFPKQP